jgi:hypothetical protein
MLLMSGKTALQRIDELEQAITGKSLTCSQRIILAMGS